MVTTEEIKSYLERMYGNELYTELDISDQEKIIFNAHELLKDNYREKSITDRAVALQVLFMLEGEAEEYAKLKRHGITSYSVKGVSVSFDGDTICQSVIDIIGSPKKSSVGRLI